MSRNKHDWARAMMLLFCVAGYGFMVERLLEQSVPGVIVAFYLTMSALTALVAVAQVYPAEKPD